MSCKHRAMEPTALLLEENKKRVVSRSPNPQWVSRNPIAWVSFKATLTPPTFLQILSALPFLGLFQGQHDKLLSRLHVPTKLGANVMLAYWGNLNRKNYSRRRIYSCFPQSHVLMQSLPFPLLVLEVPGNTQEGSELRNSRIINAHNIKTKETTFIDSQT